MPHTPNTNINDGTTMRHALPRARPLSRRLAAAVLLALAASGAHAQVAQPLDPAVISARSIPDGSPGDAAITTLVQTNTPALTSDDAGAMQRARENLLAPLASPDVSVAFRQTLARKLAQTLVDMAKADRAATRLAAIKIAAALGTEETLPVVTAAYASDRQADRLFAFARTRELFESLSAQTPAMSAGSIGSLISRIAAAAQAETNPVLLDAQVKALGAAANTTGPGFAQGRSAARSALARTMSQRIRNADARTISPDFLLVHLRAGTLIRNTLTSVDNARPGRDEALAAIEFGGDLIKFIDDRLKAGAIPAEPDARALPTQLVAVAEAMILLGANAVADASGTSLTIPPPNLASLLQPGRERDFRQRAVELIGEGGPLTRAPIGLPGTRFIGG